MSDLRTLDGVVGRGGLLKPIGGGTYRVSEAMVEDLRSGVSGEHASNLGGILAWEISRPLGLPAFIVDPVVVDEMEEIARYSGLPALPRKSIFHALNQKAVARRAAGDLGKGYGELNLIVAHLGGGISVGAHRRGRVVDVNNALDGDGPFSPERSGGVPAGDLAKLCFSGTIRRAGGEAHDHRRRRPGSLPGDQRRPGDHAAGSKAGDREAETVFRAMAYQVAKEIGALAAVLSGDIDAVVLTGGLAHNGILVEWIRERVGFLGRVLVYAGEDEMIALAQGALRVLGGDEEARDYAP